MAQSNTPTLTTLGDFNVSLPGDPTIDANGDVLAITQTGGKYGDGMVVEFAKTASGYATTPTVLVNFDGTNGLAPTGSLFTNSQGDLFGTTSGGGADGHGSVFEIVKTAGGYANAPTTLISFNLSDGEGPNGSLITDANGDLFGTTQAGGSGADNSGTVFEISKPASAYASSPITLFNFDYDIYGSGPGGLLADAKGDLFGVTSRGGDGGPLGAGTVFEIVKTASGYASTPINLAQFAAFGPESPIGSLVSDAEGDLFGIATNDGVGGEVFEIPNTGTGYAVPTALATFTATTNHLNPVESLIIDANGDLFGTTSNGGTYGDGTVFEIASTADGYGNSPTILASFDGTDGASPVQGGLIADANGDLIGSTSSGGTNSDGTVFEITDSGYVTGNPVCFVRGTRLATPRGEAAVEELRPGDEVTTPVGPTRVRWVGERAYAGRFLVGNHLGLPVTIKAGALGENIPSTDLHVSPGHGIWLEGVLVPAWRLVNGVSITQAKTVDAVTYYNVELEGHGLLMAQGAVVESFLDDGQFRNMFQNVAEYWKLYPEAPACRDVTPLPRVEEGFKLAVIQTRVNHRAGIVVARAVTGRVQGFIDEISADGLITGWAQDVSAPETPLVLNVIANDRFTSSVLANGYRADLRKAGLGSGCHGFALRLPEGCTGQVVVQRASDGAELEFSNGARQHAA